MGAKGGNISFLGLQEMVLTHSRKPAALVPSPAFSQEWRAEQTPAGVTTRFWTTDTQKPLTGSSHVTSLPATTPGIY